MLNFKQQLKSRLSQRASAIGTKKKQRGVTMIEALLGVTILGATYFGLVEVMGEQSQDIRGQVAAQQLKQVQAAAERYIRDNYDDLVGDGPTVVPHTDLLGNYLPPSFADAGGNTIRPNPFGHDYLIMYRGIGGSEVQAVVLTNPVADNDLERIPSGQLGRIAQLMGADGGYICPQNPTGEYDQPGVCRTPGNAQISNQAVAVGAHGGWQLDLQNFDGLGGNNLRQGGLAAQASFGESQVLNDYLYRYDIGVDAANQMFTELEMNNRAILVSSNDAGNADYTIQIGSGGGLDPLGGDSNRIVIADSTGGGTEGIRLDGDDGNNGDPAIKMFSGGNEVVTLDGEGFLQIQTGAGTARLDSESIQLSNPTSTNQFIADSSAGTLLLRSNSRNLLEMNVTTPGRLIQRGTGGRIFLDSQANAGRMIMYDTAGRNRVDLNGNANRFRIFGANTGIAALDVNTANGQVLMEDTSGRTRTVINNNSGVIDVRDTSNRARARLNGQAGDIEAFNTAGSRASAELSGNTGIMRSFNSRSSTRTIAQIGNSSYSNGYGLMRLRDLNGNGGIEMRGNDSSIRTNSGILRTVGSLQQSGNADFLNNVRIRGDLTLDRGLRIRSDQIILTDLSNQTLNRYLPNYTFKQAWLVSNGQRVSRPSCPSGSTPKVFVDGAATRYKIGNWARYTQLLLRARSSGSSWIIDVQTRGQSTYNTASVRTDSAGTAVVRTYCYRNIS
ncbi:MAG: hypothetical protein Alpg2KO_25070 [Alphaproteobacteria bacterium]